jgi:hypothetical protein
MGGRRLTSLFAFVAATLGGLALIPIAATAAAPQSGGAKNGTAVVLNPMTGAVYAMAGAKNGTAVVLNPMTGAVYAMASAFPSYPLLINQAGLRVYGPSERVGTQCPSLLSLPPRAMRVVERAVALAMPRYEARVKLNGRNALIVAVVPARSSGYSAVAGGCSQKVWARSIVAVVRLPLVNGASLSQHTFAVGRISQGWVLWALIH